MARIKSTALVALMAALPAVWTSSVYDKTIWKCCFDQAPLSLQARRDCYDAINYSENVPGRDLLRGFALAARLNHLPDDRIFMRFQKELEGIENTNVALTNTAFLLFWMLSDRPSSQKNLAMAFQQQLPDKQLEILPAFKGKTIEKVIWDNWDRSTTFLMARNLAFLDGELMDTIATARKAFQLGQDRTSWVRTREKKIREAQMVAAYVRSHIKGKQFVQAFSDDILSPIPAFKAMTLDEQAILTGMALASKTAHEKSKAANRFLQTLISTKKELGEKLSERELRTSFVLMRALLRHPLSGAGGLEAATVRLERGKKVRKQMLSTILLSDDQLPHLVRRVFLSGLGMESTGIKDYHRISVLAGPVRLAAEYLDSAEIRESFKTTEPAMEVRKRQFSAIRLSRKFSKRMSKQMSQIMKKRLDYGKTKGIVQSELMPKLRKTMVLGRAEKPGKRTDGKGTEVKPKQVRDSLVVPKLSLQKVHELQQPSRDTTDTIDQQLLSAFANTVRDPQEQSRSSIFMQEFLESHELAKELDKDQRKSIDANVLVDSLYSEELSPRPVSVGFDDPILNEELSRIAKEEMSIGSNEAASMSADELANQILAYAELYPDRFSSSSASFSSDEDSSSDDVSPRGSPPGTPRYTPIGSPRGTPRDSRMSTPGPAKPTSHTKEELDLFERDMGLDRNAHDFIDKLIELQL